MKNINKILTTLSLAASDTREDTIKSIIRTTLKEGSRSVTEEELIENINIVYDISIYQAEFQSILKVMHADGDVLVNNKMYSLSQEQLSNLVQNEAQLASAESIRYQNFKNFIAGKSNKELSEAEYKLLWKTFKNYLYECFYLYGVKAIEMLHPKYTTSGSTTMNQTELVANATKILKKQELISIFKIVIDLFPDFATKEDLDFIDEIGQKTLAFASLGLSPEEAADEINVNLVDWTLYLDTNFLFSILDLHTNIENEACKELLKLVTINKDIIKIKFRYSELTLKELRRKKNDFTSLDDSLTNSAIKAILRSEDLDEFARKFYSDLLSNRDSVLHPTKVIDLAETTLPQHGIAISRNKQQIESLGENYIGAKINDYQRYITQINDSRQEYAKEKSINLRYYFRSDSQLEHDVTLRELILSSRKMFKSQEIKTFNEVKYFGVTLDDLLIKYDQYQIKSNISTTYPTFFRPSFLLNKLVRLLPVKTTDYKKAFIKAVSSRGFHREPDKSNDIIQVASYLKRLGIDNEDVLFNLISEKLFLERFHSEKTKQDFNGQNFIESELNKILSEKQKELDKSKNDLAQLTSQRIQESAEKEHLQTQKNRQEDELRVLSTAMEKLTRQVKKLEKGKLPVATIEIPFQQSTNGEHQNQTEKQLEAQRVQFLEYENSRRKPLRDRFIYKKILFWRLRSFSYILLSLLPIVFVLLYLWDQSRADEVEYGEVVKSFSGNIFITILVPLLNTIFSGFLVKRFSDQFSASNVNAAKLSFEKELPADLKEIK